MIRVAMLRVVVVRMVTNILGNRGLGIEWCGWEGMDTIGGCFRG